MKVQRTVTKRDFMIREVQGDILLTKAQLLAHGVGPDDNFNQGLAHALREMWPSLYKDFRHFCHSGGAEEGGMWVWKGTAGPAIANLFTQQAPRQTGGHAGRATLESVNHA